MHSQACVWLLAPTVLQAFRRDRPKLDLEIREFAADRRLAAARDDLLDVAFIFKPLAAVGFSRSIGSENLACVGLRLPWYETLQSAATWLEVIHRLSAKSTRKYGSE
jgi:DNA-binding transcriptional LysR family regulator